MHVPIIYIIATTINAFQKYIFIFLFVYRLMCQSIFLSIYLSTRLSSVSENMLTSKKKKPGWKAFSEKPNIHTRNYVVPKLVKALVALSGKSVENPASNIDKLQNLFYY